MWLRFMCLVPILIAATMTRSAVASNINGTMQEDFTCSQANCTTACYGPGGETDITSYKDLSAWTIGQPDRLWLQKTDSQNNTSLIVLGVGDRCLFQGMPLTISSPVEVSPIGPPVPPQCTCVGNQCIPPGCNNQPQVSPLR